MSDETKVNPEEPERALVSRRKFLGGVAGAGIGGLALAGILAACGQDDDGGEAAAPPGEEPAATTAAGQTAADTSQPILIGAAYPTVNSPADAEQMERGSGLARQEINDAGGVGGRTIEQEIVDMNSFDGESLTSAFNDLISREPDAIILGYHNVAGTNDVVAEYGAPFLNASTADWQVTEMRSDPEKYKNVFQVDPTEVPYGIGFPPFLESLITQGLFNPPSKSIYIIEGDIVYGQTIAAAAEEAAPAAGWEIVGKDPVDTAGGTAPVTDWAPFIDNVRSSGASVVFNTHWNPGDHAAFMKAWVADPPDAFVYLQYGASVPEFLELAGDAANGAVWATVLGTMNDPIGLALPGALPGDVGCACRLLERGHGLRRALHARPCVGHHGRHPELRRQHHRAQAQHPPRRLGRLLDGSRRGELLPLLSERDRRSVAREPAPVLPDPAGRHRGPRAHDHRSDAVHPGGVRPAAMAELLGG